ncbi:hypothetical protein BST61_g941 [Cercospora zeina]
MAERDRVDSGAGLSWALCRPPWQQRDADQPRFDFSTRYSAPGSTGALDGSAQVFKPGATEAAPASKALPEVFVAAGRALATADLLEAILVRLPERALLSVQRVSKAWHAAIADSNALQERLFFQPYRQSLQAVINPLVCSWCPLPCKSDVDSRAATGGRVRSHPELLHVWFGSIRAPPSVWRMYLTQPPATRFTLSIFDDDTPHLTHRKLVKKAGGVTFGDVLEAYSLLIVAWKKTVSANCPVHLVDNTLRRSQQPNVFVLFDPPQEKLGNSILTASDRDIEVVR